MVYRRGGVRPPDNASIVENVGTRRALSEEFIPQISQIHTDSIFGHGTHGHH